MGDAEQYAILGTKGNGGFVRLREGDQVPAGDLRVITVTKSFVVVEDKNGRRYRLFDLLRATPRPRGRTKRRKE